MLVRNITTRVDIPHEPGEWMLLRRLTWKQLRVAEEKREDIGVERMKRLGGEILTALQSVKSDGTAKKDVLTGYDVEKLLEQGIANWSYAGTSDTGSNEYTRELLLDLDHVTAEWAAREILRLSGVVDDEAAEEKKSNPAV